MCLRKIVTLLCCIIAVVSLSAQNPGASEESIARPAKEMDSSFFYEAVNTYINPVLPGDHPDPTLLKVGDDFYHCGSSFHFNPYLPIYHSKDLVHWKIISRVLPPSRASMVSDKPSGGVWQGALTYFYGSYWIYFSAGGQWFSQAPSPAGPWSEPVQVRTNPQTGPLGYDNSIFVDEDGKPYMVIKNGQKVNRLQALGKDGQLADTVINLDWINAKLQYSWAEGPVMCKRNGYYYYFPAGDVSGGQYVLRASALTADSSKWERLGNFFKPSPDPNNTFQRPNHISAPVQLADGTWWVIGQSYQRHEKDDWSGMGRQTSLYQVIWEGDRPWGLPPVSTPAIKPALNNEGISWRHMHSDHFDGDSLELCWHFLDRTSAANYSLKEHKGWIRLKPDSGRTHLLQKETDHFYSVVTRLQWAEGPTTGKGGIYLTNGNQAVFARLYAERLNNTYIQLQLDTAIRRISYDTDQPFWLKLERHEHWLTGYVSKDGKQWVQVGDAVNALPLDRTQPNYNSWVGTSVGLFAEGGRVDFDCFLAKDGFSAMPVMGNSNHFGIRQVRVGDTWLLTNNSTYGGWLMLSGVDFGKAGDARAIEIVGTASKAGKLELRVDDLQKGQKLATVSVSPGPLKKHRSLLTRESRMLSGQHDVFVKFPPGAIDNIQINTLRLLYR